MSPLSKPEPLSDFTRLAGAVYLCTPPADVSSTSGTPSHDRHEPDLIIICTWMDAQARYIAKYTSHYQKTYPTTPILLITCSLFEMLFHPYRLVRRNLKSAVDVVAAHAKQATLESRRPRMPLHLFSNGGSMKACQLATAFRMREARALPVSSMFIDSAPSLPVYWRSVNAMKLGLPRNVVAQSLGQIAIHTVMMFFIFGELVLRFENFFLRLRKDMVRSSLFPPGAPRCYLYSEADKMVWYKHVEAHAAEAEEAGVQVSRVRFKASGHAGHVIEDHSRYWNAVQAILHKSESSA